MKHSWTLVAAVALGGLSFSTSAMAQNPGAVEAQRPVSRITDPRDGYPDVSPDGRRIAFQSNRTGTWQLWVVNADGSGLTRLTHGSANDVTPVWSPDGSRILFASDRAGGAARDFDPAESFDSRDIFVMDVSAGLEGAEQRITRLVDHPGDDMHPEWAQSGRSIVFNRVYESGDGADILIMDADGSDVRRVDLPRGWNTYANLTPDGTRLVYRGTFQETRDGEPFENSDIVSAAPDGSDRVRLTTDQAFDGWPAVSPDGRWIAFSSGGYGQRYHVYLMPIDGGEPRQITFGDTFSYTQPAWAPDGRSLTTYRWIEDEIAEVGHIVRIALEE